MNFGIGRMKTGILREYSNPINFIARLVDFLSILIGAYVAYFLKFQNLEFNTGYIIAIILGIAFVGIVYPLYGIYQSWRGRSQFVHLRYITIAISSVFVLLLLIAYITKTSSLFSREWLITWIILTWLVTVVFRLLVWSGLKYLRSKGYNHRRIIIYGAGALGMDVYSRLKLSSWVGFDVVGFMDDNLEICRHKNDINCFGSISDLENVVIENSIDEVWITLPLRAEERVREIVHNLRNVTATIRFVPDIFTFRLLNHSISEISGLPVLNLTETPMHGLNRIIKWLEDKILSLFILVFIFPLIIVISIGVKLTSPGPIFYRQERIGWNGKSFMMLKFRSMPVGLEKTKVEWGGAQNKTNTKFGMFIRKTSLDELPQFINVLKGDMSIVGPRPERTIFVEKFKDEIPDYMKKHLVKAGITGWAQINGWRGDTDLQKRIEFDLYYIENWSLWFDVRIILLTIVKGFINKSEK